MNLARNLERRIEQLVEGIGGKVFRGSLHPVEVAIRIVREAELSLVESGIGPVAPNHFDVEVNPADLAEDADRVVARLNDVVFEAARERGWRLDGPPAVLLHSDNSVTPGSVRVKASAVTGALPPWALLVETTGSRRLQVTKNRSLLGRSRKADLMLGDDSVSRTHALLWYDSGGVWVQDLASSNGTTVNGRRIDQPTALHHGDVLGFGVARFGFRPA